MKSSQTLGKPQKNGWSPVLRKKVVVMLERPSAQETLAEWRALLKAYPKARRFGKVRSVMGHIEAQMEKPERCRIMLGQPAYYRKE